MKRFCSLAILALVAFAHAGTYTVSDPYWVGTPVKSGVAVTLSYSLNTSTHTAHWDIIGGISSDIGTKSQYCEIEGRVGWTVSYYRSFPADLPPTNGCSALIATKVDQLVVAVCHSDSASTAYPWTASATSGGTPTNQVYDAMANIVRGMVGHDEEIDGTGGPVSIAHDNIVTAWIPVGDHWEGYIEKPFKVYTSYSATGGNSPIPAPFYPGSAFGGAENHGVMRLISSNGVTLNPNL